MKVDVVATHETALIENTQDARLLNNLAGIHQQFGMHSTALNLLQLSIWIAPDAPETLRLMAKSYFRTSQFPETLTTLRQLQSLIGPSQLTENETLMQISVLALLGEAGEARELLQNQTGDLDDAN